MPSELPIIFSASDMQRKSTQILNTAKYATVVVTRNQERFVVLTADAYDRLARAAQSKEAENA